MTHPPDPLHPLPDPTPSVFCIIVNWNGWQDTLACLDSLRVQDYPRLTVLVVDNASTNESAARIRQASPATEILLSPSNLGFAGGCNLGIRHALARGADFVWLLNNDTVAPPNTLAQLLAAFAPKVGIVGTVLRFMHDPTRIQAWGGGRIRLSSGVVTHFEAPARLGQDSFLTKDSFLTFASVLIRAEVFARIGLMDPRYFMYFDDSDFCFRARRAGWQLTVAPGTAVLHKEGASLKRLDAPRNHQMDSIVTASGLRFLRLHAPLPVLAMPLFVLLKLGKRLAALDFQAARAVTRGVTDWRRGSTVPSAEDTTA